MTATTRNVIPSPLLLTPGPLTTAAATRAALDRDWGSRNADFLELTARVRKRLTALLGHGEDFDAVPLQGSGTYAVEAMIATLVPRDDGVLILENGAYGRRMAEICRRHGRRFETLSWADDAVPPMAKIEDVLTHRPDLGHVAVVHVETTSGALNPIEEIARLVVGRHNRHLLIDAMSAFGALTLDAQAVPFKAMAASSNKCLEGVPGIAFTIARRTALEKSAGNAASLSLDLYEQWRGFETTGEWRFTPPTHVVAALDAALDGLDAEGGVEARGQRYRNNCARLREGMMNLGFRPFLPDSLQSPIIVTFVEPSDPNFDFARFYDGLLTRGYAIYPGKLTKTPSFRIGCIGQITADDMAGVVQAAQDTLLDMGVTLR